MKIHNLIDELTDNTKTVELIHYIHEHLYVYIYSIQKPKQETVVIYIHEKLVFCVGLCIKHLLI